MCPAWLLVAVVVVGGARGAASQCWESLSCQELNSESSMMDCIHACRSDLTAETPLAKRSYSMEHFRWGKPVGRKRRPVKVYTSNGVQEESAEAFPAEMRRRSDEEEEEEEEQLLQEKKDGSYKMKHFRWSGPPAGKRYGGFMKSWEEGRQKPLVTLLKNIINKEEETSCKLTGRFWST
uniref:Proopiomelanocortin a n=1 Tax=Xiphophorus maculatus TaxID=8083 RepID=A0A3B5QYR7_XIPMA